MVAFSGPAIQFTKVKGNIQLITDPSVIDADLITCDYGWEKSEEDYYNGLW